MADIFSKDQRSRIMSLIKGKGSLLERDFEKQIKKLGRYKKQMRTLPGKPDFAFPQKRVAIFIDSCFWHGCRYHGTVPKTNRKFWTEKISRNKLRDRRVTLEYKKMGWSVVRIWEHKLKKSTGQALGTIIENLRLMLK